MILKYRFACVCGVPLVWQLYSTVMIRLDINDLYICSYTIFFSMFYDVSQNILIDDSARQTII